MSQMMEDADKIEVLDDIVPTTSNPTSSLNADFFPESLKDTDPTVIEKLTYGVLAAWLPQLQIAKSSIQELTENQRILIETVLQENAKFADSAALVEVTDVMGKAKLYHTKLLNIKKEMAALHEKSARLKRRALRLQQQKQKEALQLEQEREREMERERRLVAKAAKKK